MVMESESSPQAIIRGQPGQPAKDPREYEWYIADIPSIPENARLLLEQYSEIPSDKVLEHVKEVIELLKWYVRYFHFGSDVKNTVLISGLDQWPYPCIGTFRFLDLSIPKNPCYREIVSRVKSGETFLDLGCAFGQELRQLIFEGASGENLYGSDLRTDFTDIGYELFRDRAKLKAQFIIADVFDDSSELVEKLAGQVDIINACSFFHLFDWDQQVAVAKRVIQLLRPQPGSLLVGRQVGMRNPGVHSRAGFKSVSFRHNVDSWKDFWENIGAETGSHWQVDARQEQWGFHVEEARKFHDEGTFELRFAIRRL